LVPELREQVHHRAAQVQRDVPGAMGHVSPITVIDALDPTEVETSIHSLTKLNVHDHIVQFARHGMKDCACLVRRIGICVVQLEIAGKFNNVAHRSDDVLLKGIFISETRLLE
jgi:hypothetical protein